MMTCEALNKISVFCVDDNPLVNQALKLQLAQVVDMKWAGSATTAEALIEQAALQCPDVVLLDIDMPGKDAFEAIEELIEMCRDAKVLMYSGLIRRDLIDRAIESGAWGYVAKTDGEDDLFHAIRAVNSGALGFSRSIKALLQGN